MCGSDEDMLMETASKDIPPASHSRTLLSSSAWRLKRRLVPVIAFIIFLPVKILVHLMLEIYCFFYLSTPVDGSSFWVLAPNRSSISSSKVRVKKRGHGQGQSSSGSAGGSGAGNAVRSRGTGGGENGRTGLAMGEGRSGNVGGGGRRRGNNGGDEENNGGDMGGNLDLDWWERAVMLFTIIMALIQGILNLCGAELSSITTPGSVIGYFSTITSLLALVCYEVVRRQPYLNPRVARILNPRIIGILSGTGSALAVLGFISRMAIDLPLHLSPIFILAFLVLLIFFLVDIL